MAESNAQQVLQVRKIIEGLGLEIATPDEAREILQLKGADKCGILITVRSPVQSMDRPEKHSLLT